jgi:NAD-dependent DNA ligase
MKRRTLTISRRKNGSPPPPTEKQVRTKENLQRLIATRRQARKNLKNIAQNQAKNIANTMSAAATQIKDAKKAYYETGKPIITDDEYDILETAALRDGSIDEDVGIRPEKGVPLPVPMTSLKKIKPGEDGLRRFLTGGRNWIISEKLDGISALWVTNSSTSRLYLRGDAYIGTEVSQYIPYIKGLLPAPFGKQTLIVRGELVLRKVDADPATPARSQVNGWLHKAISPATGRLPVRFVAYQLIEPHTGTRVSQFAELQRIGFDTAWNITKTTLDEADCVELFSIRRAASEYDTDGIVIAPQAAPLPVPEGAAYPTDMVAFKMPSADQIADTRVVAVEWRPTRLGVLAPRVEIEPVSIGGATITYVTGHNAKFIETNRIGPGAIIRIRRSGDVIPIIDTVLDGVEPALPAPGSWIWKGVHIVKEDPHNAESALEKLKFSMKILEVEGAGGATVETAWTTLGLHSISDILTADTGKLAATLGKTIGPRMQERLKERLARAPMTNRLLATGMLPAGIGLARLDKIAAAHPNPTVWASIAIPSGWGADTWNGLLNALPAALNQINEWNTLLGVKTADLPDTTVAVATSTPLKGEVCFTGFRDKIWENSLREAGWGVADTVKKTLIALIIPDKENPVTYVSSKAEKARQYGIPIYRKSDFAVDSK